jgi:hypothetical protein
VQHPGDFEFPFPTLLIPRPQEDLDVIAFAYAPVPHSARESLTGPDAAHKMDYLVYAESYEVTKSVHSSPAGAGGVATPMSPTDEDTSILSRLSREDSDSNRAQSLPPKPKPSSSSSFRAEEYTMTSDSQLEPSGELEARKGAVKMARSLSADKISFMDADSAEFLSSEVESLREEAELLMAEGGVAANDVKGDGGPTVEGRASTTPVSIRAESTPNSPSSHSAFDFGDELGLRRGRSRPRMKRGSSGTTKGGFSAIGGRHRPHRGSMPGGVDAAGSGDGMTTLTAKAFDNIWGLTHEQVTHDSFLAHGLGDHKYLLEMVTLISFAFYLCAGVFGDGCVQCGSSSHDSCSDRGNVSLRSSLCVLFTKKHAQE